jgi:hypothetical protein
VAETAAGGGFVGEVGGGESCAGGRHDKRRAVFAPRFETTLPSVSVIARPPLTVPELPRPVIGQVRRQVGLTEPALAVTPSKATFLAAPAETVKASGLAAEIVPSVALTLAAAASGSLVSPFLLEETAATPLVKVSAVGLPKAVAVPAAETTVGFVPLGLGSAPEKVMFLDPAYDVAVLA